MADCPKCNCSKGYIARIQSRGDCEVDRNGNWEKSLTVDDTQIYGPFVCKGCGAEFDELPG